MASANIGELVWPQNVNHDAIVLSNWIAEDVWTKTSHKGSTEVVFNFCSV